MASGAGKSYTGQGVSGRPECGAVGKYATITITLPYYMQNVI